jgi:methyl-accepting chemotaxis protein
MGRSRWSGFQGKLSALIGLFLFALVALVAVANVALYTVKVDGPLYADILRGKDLENDLSPPYLYLRGPHITVDKMLAETDPGRRRELVSLFRELERGYRERREYWEKELPDGPVKTALREEVYPPLAEFFEVANRDILPHAERGTGFPPAAAEVFKGRLTALFEKQEGRSAG